MQRCNQLISSGGRSRVVLTRHGQPVAKIGAIRKARLTAVQRAWAIEGVMRSAAGPNCGDCFACELAEGYGYPRLFVGNTFSQPDLVSAL